MKKKVAIACQGGGSQTAFTAGVLKSFFKHDVHKTHEIVSLSGSSGGAVCAALAWYGLLKQANGDKTPIENRLEAFWSANSTQNILEEVLNDSLVQFSQLIGEGLIPEWKTSPTSPINQAMVSASKATFPRFFDFKSLLETHIDFEEIEKLTKPSSPVLLIGAANVLSGEFKKFNSLKNEIQLESLLASSAVPSIFPAVKIKDDAYWDGLFSDNPPTDELIQSTHVGVERKPDELWVIQINPKERKEIPTSPEDILDRQNEMIENESLFQDLQHIEMVNTFLKDKAFTKKYLDEKNYKPIEIYTITMSEKLLGTLDHSSKMNRNASFIDGLIKDGEKQGSLFLQNQKTMQYQG